MMKPGCVLFDWGGTLMTDFPEYAGPMAAWPRVAAIPGARETLEQLRADGWLTALATNAAASEEPEIRLALGRVQLDSLIDRIYCARGVGHAKPSPEFFRHAVSDLRLPASQIVMVGDSYVADVQGANRASLRAVHYRPGAAVSRGGDAWWVIGNLSDLPALLKSLD